MITLDENIRGIWYCPIVPGEQDFLLALTRIEDKHYEINYRFRYYNSDDPFDEEDKKSWYRATIKDKPEEEVISAMSEALSLLSRGAKVTELLRGDRPFKEFMDEFMEQDFVHAQGVH